MWFVSIRLGKAFFYFLRSQEILLGGSWMSESPRVRFLAAVKGATHTDRSHRHRRRVLTKARERSGVAVVEAGSPKTTCIPFMRYNSNHAIQGGIR